MGILNELQSNLSIKATKGNRESDHCRQVATKTGLTELSNVLI